MMEGEEDEGAWFANSFIFIIKFNKTSFFFPLLSPDFALLTKRKRDEEDESVSADAASREKMNDISSRLEVKSEQG